MKNRLIVICIFLGLILNFTTKDLFAEASSKSDAKKFTSKIRSLQKIGRSMEDMRHSSDFDTLSTCGEKMQEYQAAVQKLQKRLTQAW